MTGPVGSFVSCTASTYEVAVRQTTIKAAVRLWTEMTALAASENGASAPQNQCRNSMR